MRLFGVSMMRNEADIVELFVRHNLRVLDGLAVIDHRSHDGTAEILAQLRAEQPALRVIADSAAGFFQAERMTALARQVLAEDEADFVFLLDADEFMHVESRARITHRDSRDAAWHVDVLDPRRSASDLAVLDGVLIAARREVLSAIPFDAPTFDGFHLYDLDWSYRAFRADYRLGVVGELMLVHASRGRYDDAWERYADRFCLKHAIYRTPPPPSSFFGVTLADSEQVRQFFKLLAALGA